MGLKRVPSPTTQSGQADKNTQVVMMLVLDAQTEDQRGKEGDGSSVLKRELKLQTD
ncbi:hypothetical protein BY996DRAFT_6602494, partial [Phakopsora pachyrhizi]